MSPAVQFGPQALGRPARKDAKAAPCKCYRFVMAQSRGREHEKMGGFCQAAFPSARYVGRGHLEERTLFF